ncbi:AAA family ATPase [Flavobacterium aquidurense]|uniref:AAA family ATPase n=1 Tax=Flavobacterium aquidurense TaxID=362413 RepID=UPI0028583CFB|nr:AAA family ATPase [Flavobacterium aquidurense]MDR7371084.1 putative ATPase [Flavobacterium aquidurense]
MKRLIKKHWQIKVFVLPIRNYFLLEYIYSQHKNIMGDISGNFKLIGIQPHLTCDQKFTKVLERGRLYQFYREFIFLNAKGDQAKVGDTIVSYIRVENEVPSDLFTIDNLNINISAIVGKNGSGKSSLIELLLYSIYKLGITLKDEFGQPVLKTYSQQAKEDVKLINDILDIDLVKTIELQKYFLIANNQKTVDYSQKLDEFSYIDNKIKESVRRKDLLEKNIAEAQKENDFIISKLKCSIFFEVDGVVCELNTDDQVDVNLKVVESDENPVNAEARNIRIFNLLDPNDYKILSSFFYTMVLNYSHHGLNSSHLGFWITMLFHKNDGYKAPAVINPMRKEGNFDINTENALAKSRLLMNLLVQALHHRENPKKIKLTDKQYVYKVRFELDQKNSEVENNYEEQYYLNYEDRFIGKKEMNENILKLLTLYYKELTPVISQKKELPFTDEIIDYLKRKIPKALKKYPRYGSLLGSGDTLSYFDAVLKVLRDDKSHVTFKIERALFFLRKLLEPRNAMIWTLAQERGYIDFDLYELLEWMEIKEIKDLHLIFERIPPSVFKIDFILDTNKLFVSNNFKEEKLPTLDSLSSGEQQKIHIINGVVYHLNNIFSVHNSHSAITRTKYNYVNIIFDEIELYFHPDFQREFIYDLLQNIKRLSHITQDKDKRIKGLNLIFSTHSPFILSDIPVQNILKIEYDQSLKAAVPILEGTQTFGANIHDLLANSFFFKNKAFSGKKADDYLKQLIRKINSYDKEIPYAESQELLKKASLIGENFFREKLLEMILSNSEKTSKALEDLIEKKRKELEDLENRKNNLNNDLN